MNELVTAKSKVDHLKFENGNSVTVIEMFNELKKVEEKINKLEMTDTSAKLFYQFEPDVELLTLQNQSFGSVVCHMETNLSGYSKQNFG